jgi:hypothetical protein
LPSAKGEEEDQDREIDGYTEMRSFASSVFVMAVWNVIEEPNSTFESFNENVSTRDLKF